MSVLEAKLEETCCPLVMTWRAKMSFIQEWELKFYSKPLARIVLKGREPTRDELIECLQNTNYPFSFLPILEICIAVAEKAGYSAGIMPLISLLFNVARP